MNVLSYALICIEQKGLILIAINFIFFIQRGILSIKFLSFTLDIDKNSKRINLIKYIYLILGCIYQIFLPYYACITLLLLTWNILSFYILKFSFLKGFFSGDLALIIILMLRSIIIKVLQLLFGTTSIVILTTPIFSLILNSMLILLFYNIYSSFKRNNYKFSIIDSNAKTKKVFMIDFLISVPAFFTIYTISIIYIDKLPIWINLFFNISLFSFVFIVMHDFISLNKLNSKREDIKKLKLYNKSLSSLNDNIRGFKHDFSNILQAIGGYISTNDMNGLEEYYKELLEDYNKINQLSILSPEIINNPAVYSILASKYHKAQECGININFEIFLDFSKLNIKVYEFARILGILLDNAIEATLECSDREINIIFKTDIKNNRQLIIVKNTFNNKEINIDEIYQKGYSTKESNTGLGLWEVKEIMKRNDNLNLFTTKNENFFVQQLEIYGT